MNAHYCATEFFICFHFIPFFSFSKWSAGTLTFF